MCGGEQKLAGASLLVLANKQDLAGALSVEEISKVPIFLEPTLVVPTTGRASTAPT